MTLFANEVYNYWTNDDDHQIRVVEYLPETIFLASSWMKSQFQIYKLRLCRYL